MLHKLAWIIATHSPSTLQNKSATSVAENREAQRRSRARRQELIENLQCRLEQYERMGIAASVEMQRVARAVNTQNQLLKNLLGVCGVSQEEIERFLSSPEGDYRALNDRQRCDTCGQNERVFVPQGEERRLHHQIHTANRLDNITADCSSAPTDRLSPLFDSFDSSKSISPYSNHSGALETSCDKAAGILLELHNRVDPSWARSALGCHGNSYCHVKNTKIFQLMDHLD
ncbi:unnamed protein product [Clonostachys solani]|uniref:BZIP domain-containing protein n=1 Tax=Clonostachys solani TaxID=160281 RepID=A0A9P0ELJ9_9HYPO|nr:unnamed protein product [Clonostachys solani]